MNWQLTDEVKYRRAHPMVPFPVYKTEGSMAFDVTAWLGEDKQIGMDGIKLKKHGGTHIFDTGLSFEVPRGWAIEANVRSGMGCNHKVCLSNNQGWIDSDYRGNLYISLINLGDEDYYVYHGDRIAQCRVVPAPQIGLVEVAELTTTVRGTGGLGHTGR